MIERAFVRVAGPAGTGKTTLIERLLEARSAWPLMVARVEANAGGIEPVESNRADDAEIRRYVKAGASGVTRYRFHPEHAPGDALWSTDFMEDYPQGIIFEGDWPLDYRPDLTVYVARPLPEGSAVLERVADDRKAKRAAAKLQQLERALEDPKYFVEFVGPMLGMLPRERARSAMEEMLPDMQDLLDKMKKKGLPPPEERWAVASELAGIEHAQVVAINVRTEGERRRAETMVPELRRIRNDKEVYDNLLGWRGKRLPITIRIADLAAPGDKGLKDILKRIGRAFKTMP